MTRAEAIDRDKKVCLNPHAPNAKKNRALHKLVDNGIAWATVRKWLLEGTPLERIRLLDVLANPRASAEQTRFACQRLLQTGMPHAGICVWLMIHREPETFSRVFRSAAKKMPNVLKMEIE